VGGGGLLAGVVTWFADRHPETRLVGVEPAGAASLRAALDAGGPVDLDHVETFVDGAAVRRIGEGPYSVVAAAGTEVVSVPEGQVCSEMLDMYQTDGIIAEPAGALATAALRSAVHVEPGQTVVALVSGGNNDVSRYSEIVERSLVFEGRKHYFLVNFPQEPGSLRRFLDEVLGPDDDITLFEYVKRSNRELGPALVGIELGDPGELPGLLDRMAASPMTVEPIDPDGPFYRFLV
jgi:threonine dehydratase